MRTNLNAELTAKVRQALAKARNQKDHWKSFIGFTVTIDGTQWQNFGGHNGNPWDLWLIKQGTAGGTTKTFRRITLPTGGGEA